MAGYKLTTGLTGRMTAGPANGSVVGSLYGGYGSASVPGASTVPEGPTTITQQAYGVPGVSPAGRSSRIGFKAAGIGTLALVALAIIYACLPR